ncbi:MAG TPA: JAB domain-containing protein [Flavobacteriales bacterium]|nr:JAB domain-containing protein [Flavobacteriales bacterium]
MSEENAAAFGLAEVYLTFQGATEPHHEPITTSQAGWSLFKRYFDEHMDTYEAFRMILLDQSRRPKGIFCVGKGGVCGALVDPRLIFAAALKSLSTGLVFAHNHPSGSHCPSRRDLELTERLVKIGELHEIAVLDHLILSRNGYFSFADEGLI